MNGYVSNGLEENIIMSHINSKLAELKKLLPIKAWMDMLPGESKRTYWLERITYQLEYAYRISILNFNKYDKLIEDVLDLLLQRLETDGAIAQKDVLNFEAMLTELAPVAKKYKVLCVSHAHIDMNWEWGWNETVAIVLDTFRTMLTLMKEYPEFIFSQSQAAVYKIVEKYDPEMLQEIKCRVKEKRWEITASTWVETDKNMPNGESLARHILYTKRYLSELFDIDADTLNLDFEPDTFGHSIHIPEILSSGGVKYYYHCRGYDKEFIYKWKAPSGSEVINYCEPNWYNGCIEPAFAVYIPEFCEKYGMNTALKVYGVGDHGGGPTRRDIERLLDMRSWPVFPEISFGTYAEYFKLVDQIEDTLPIVEGELNFVAPGCYTSQTRIKVANRKSEALLYEAEAYCSMASMYGKKGYPVKAFEAAWENVLFNQFHDIIPGSGVIETREHAMGLFQETVALANTNISRALRDIAAEIDTSALNISNEDIKETASEGAGAGYGSNEFRASQCERGRGKSRVFHVFNSSSVQRDENVEILLWDWEGDPQRILVTDSDGNVTGHQVMDYGMDKYWGHHFTKLLIRANVPAYGYNTYILVESKDFDVEGVPANLPRTSEHEHSFKLENDYIRVVFDNTNGSILSMLDKSTGEDFVEKGRLTGIFRIIEEDIGGGSAWDVGRYMNIRNLTENVSIHGLGTRPHTMWDRTFEKMKVKNASYETNEIRQAIIYKITFGQSELKAIISLENNSSSLKYEVECDWHEMGRKDKHRVPQLNFHMPVSYSCSSYKYDVPAGTIERKSIDMDVPGNSWILGKREALDKKCVMLVTDSKYGFRGTDNSLSISLIRSSFDPDPYPEWGIIKFSFAICLVDNTSNRELIEQAYHFNHPLTAVSNTVHKGMLPGKKSFISLTKGSVAFSSIKMGEENTGDQSIVRLYETDGKHTVVAMKFSRKVNACYFTDINEKRIASASDIKIDDSNIEFEALPFSMVTICVELGRGIKFDGSGINVES
jgi:alpha-mannosidase